MVAWGDCEKFVAARVKVGFERDEGKVSIHRGIEVQGINTPFPFTVYNQGRGVLPLSRTTSCKFS